jgi:hypothetical protein
LNSFADCAPKSNLLHNRRLTRRRVADVRFWHKADIPKRTFDVRFRGEFVSRLKEHLDGDQQ